MEDLQLFLSVFFSFAAVYYLLHRSTINSFSVEMPGLQ
ncbi:hypothetical protein ZYGR_0AK07190 [Zygosaccharomyces rouxii]|uniref:Uncharacterized protein n=1 Tax=Zygosaccharomyces rouxii TaxID=4956 RepID=A0A1Q3AER9_ZYGRO|nr:hypothetical protein ZYGR_0AK07190 [Zygosaccharomyces rouxii]